MEHAPSPANPQPIGFLSLDPDTRNHIYQLIFSHHNRIGHIITISSEKGHREVPPAISRTCRQIRRETLAYFFFDLKPVNFVVRGREDLLACREWLTFVHERAWDSVRGIRIKHSHNRGRRNLRPCNLNFDLDLDKAEVPVLLWGDWRPDCGLCSDSVPVIDLILKEMCAGGKITSSGMDLVFDTLEPFTTD